MFRSMLAQLLAEVPQARAAIFCDHEGESVDWAAASGADQAALSEYDVKICGAQLASIWLLLDERARERAAGGLRALELRAAKGTLLCHAVQDGYYLMLVLAARSGPARAARTLAQAASAFAREM